MPIRTVALLGTRGHLAPFILSALVESDKFVASALLRHDSSATIPADCQDKVRTITLPSNFADDASETALTKLLEGQDAVVVSIPASKVKEHEVLMRACVRAGVRRMIPADYGSVDSSDPVPLFLLPNVYANKVRTREALQALSVKNSNFTWTSLVCGHVFDYGLESDLLAFNLSSSPPSALIFDDGNRRWSASTRAQIGRAVVEILERESETANQVLFIQSLSASQNEVLGILEQVSGERLEVTGVRSEEYINGKKREFDEGRGGKRVFGVQAVDDLIAVMGLTRADWRGEDGVASGMGFWG